MFQVRPGEAIDEVSFMVMQNQAKSCEVRRGQARSEEVVVNFLDSQTNII